MHVGRRECLGADYPVAAFHLLDHAPGDPAHALAFDRDHGVGQLADDLLLLLLAEHILDDAHLNERHCISPLVSLCGYVVLDTRVMLPDTCQYSNGQFSISWCDCTGPMTGPVQRFRTLLCSPSLSARAAGSRSSIRSLPASSGRSMSGICGPAPGSLHPQLRRDLRS